MAMPKKEPTTVVRIPVALKDELTAILEQRKEMVKQANKEGKVLKAKLTYA